MAREKHLTAVHIGNFKRFADFQVENLGQFNLVVGDNNTGKTSFLEALVVDENGAKWIGNLVIILAQRIDINEPIKSRLPFLEENFKILLNDSSDEDQISLRLFKTDSNNHYVLHHFDLERDVKGLKGLKRERLLALSNPKGFTVHNNKEMTTVLDEKEIRQSVEEDRFIPFIPFGLGYDKYLEQFFVKNIDNNIPKRKEFIERLKLFIPKILDVRLGQNVINIFEEGRDYPKPLYTYGEGTTKFFRILCEIAVAQGKRLMIDEIDTGIHHTKFVKFWTTLIQAATEYDVQLFATTHNEECLEYFQAALEQEELAAQRELARVISLKLRKEQKISARVYDFKNLQLAEDLGHEIRGGGL